MVEKKEKPSIRSVKKLPKKAIEYEVIYNMSDGYFYMGVDTEKEAKEYGYNMEKTSV